MLAGVKRSSKGRRIYGGDRRLQQAQRRERHARWSRALQRGGKYMAGTADSSGRGEYTAGTAYSSGAATELPGPAFLFDAFADFEHGDDILLIQAAIGQGSGI